MALLIPCHSLVSPLGSCFLSYTTSATLCLNLIQNMGLRRRLYYVGVNWVEAFLKSKPSEKMRVIPELVEYLEIVEIFAFLAAPKIKQSAPYSDCDLPLPLVNIKLPHGLVSTSSLPSVAI